MIYALATVELHEGARDAFLDEFRKVVPLVHAEDGCIEYGSTVDLPTSIPIQVPPRDNVVVIVEKWRDLSALETHAVAPHMTPYRESIKDYVVQITAQILVPTDASE